MPVAERQGREMPAKTEQRKVKDWSEDLRQNKEHSWLIAIYTGQAQGEEKNTQKEEPEDPEFPSLPLATLLALSPLRVSWVVMPSCLEDAFSFIF